MQKQGHWVWIVALISLSLGCDDARGAADGGSPADAGVATTDGRVATDAASSVDAGGGGDDARFVPDIPMSYDGMIVEPGVELQAFTIYEALLDTRFLVSIRNVSPDLRLCSLDMTVRFDDASGREIALSQGGVETPPHRGVSGTGGLINCLSPGQTGMQAARVEFSAGASLEDIAAGRWSVGAINLIDAVPTSDLEVTGVIDVPSDFGGRRFRGQVTNRSSATVQNPQVSVFGINAVGRPTVEGSDIELIDIPAGGSWSFETLSFTDEVFTDTVAFPQARE